MSNIATVEADKALAKVILEGDLIKLSALEKVEYYKAVCVSCGLNPLTQPFEFIRFQGKEKLYAGKNCTEQLRDINGISLRITARDKLDDLLIVTAEATNKLGRSDSSTGAVNLKGLTGEALANAVMKAETKAKRRVTLSISGLGFLDESETDSIPGAVKLGFDMNTGETAEQKSTPPLTLINSPVANPLITFEQEAEINELIDACADRGAFYKNYNISNLSQMTHEQYNEAKGKLIRRLTQKQKAAEGESVGLS